jgi:hypothetical protein
VCPPHGNAACRYPHPLGTAGTEGQGAGAWLKQPRIFRAHHGAGPISTPRRSARGDETIGTRIDKRSAIAIAKQGR